MIVTNKITGKDVSGLYLQLMQGKITNAEFETMADINPKTGNLSDYHTTNCNGCALCEE